MQTLRMCRAAAELPVPRTLDDLNDPWIIEELLDGPLRGYGGPYRAMLLTNARVFRTRVLTLDSANLARTARRVLAEEPPIDRSTALQAYDVYHRAALSLDPRMEPGEEHLLDTALPCRQAATAIVAVEVAPRRTELTGLYMEDISITADEVWVIIPGRLSETRTTQVRQLSQKGGAIVREYCRHARPYLLSLRNHGDETPEHLWIGNDGCPIQARAVLRALNLNSAVAVGAPVSLNVLRRAMASGSDLDDAEVGNYLDQSYRSQLGPDHYANRDLAAAAANLRDIWAEFDPE